MKDEEVDMEKKEQRGRERGRGMRGGRNRYLRKKGEMKKNAYYYKGISESNR